MNVIELKLEDAKFQTNFRKFSGEQPTWFAHPMQKCDTKSTFKQAVTPISLFLTIKKSSPLFYPLTAAVTFFGLLYNLVIKIITFCVNEM